MRTNTKHPAHIAHIHEKKSTWNSFSHQNNNNNNNKIESWFRVDFCLVKHE